jgi:hypothetical protein
MRPPVPEELFEDNKELPAEGMMFVGDKGKILAGFHVDNPTLIPERRMKGIEVEIPSSITDKPTGFQLFMDACRNGKQCAGSFTEAMPITEAVNLYAVALRVGHLLKYDGSNMKITNIPDANKYLLRDYRAGWNPDTI